MSDSKPDFNQIMDEIEQTVLERIKCAKLELQCPDCGQRLCIPLQAKGEGGCIKCGCGILLSTCQT